MPVMERLSDEDLRSRLQRQNYAVPPITTSTRSVLLKKLAQLEASQPARSPVRASPPPRSRAQRNSSRLLEYSSAEDDGPVAPARPQRRTSHSSRNQAHSTRLINGSRGGTPQPPGPRAPATPNGRTPGLIHYSEDEEDEVAYDEGGPEDKLVFDAPGHEEEEESDEVDEEEEEEDESEDDGEDEDDDRMDFGVQTSPGLDSTMENSTLNSNGIHYRRNRFAASTPLTPPRSTATFMPASANPSYSLVSPALRRTIASNSQDFGSLGEALSSLPPSSAPSNNSHPHHNRSGASSNGSIVSQAARSNKSLLERSKREASSHVSKLIIGGVLLFFLLLVFKYVNLRPTPNLADHIPVCGLDSGLQVCVEPYDKDYVVKLFQDIQELLEEQSIDYLCRNATHTRALSYQALADKLKATSNRSDLEKMLLHLVVILVEKPNWGIQLLDGQGNAVSSVNDLQQLVLSSPRLDWSCWLAKNLALLWSMVAIAGVYVLWCGIVGGSVYALYKLCIWRKERQLQENQEVFELVEQVLSLLVAQHQMVARSHGPGSARPWVAVNHIRDQLIPPQEREKKRRKRIWSQVVKYINDSESRVRVDVQKIFSEEHAVWQWLPDLQWSPMNQHGPNPYVTPHTMAPPTSFVHTPVSSASPQWQGSAFTVLNRNVASPAVAPTPCVKVRHMFDSTLQKSGPGWVWQVKQEILRRCAAQAKILHIGVDIDNQEGCVYVKCGSTEDAGSVFKTLHGQWYRGHLVTVKYLREERYHDRYPDARYQKHPLKAQT
eukprot:maker-scaffold1296_size49803-snap-gene-0.16 protein:Tk08817 transcript:maker-scaffold1296_size49803-snap-gene-0.16-mRNA-1 annotation:"inner nuclear membrane protein man1-like"